MTDTQLQLAIAKMLPGIETLNQELSQVRGELEQEKEVKKDVVKLKLLAQEQRDQLAKQNHKIREALEHLIPYASQYVSHQKRNPDDNWQLRMDEANQSLTSPDLSSLTVLSRAEVENMTCHCDAVRMKAFNDDPRGVLEIPQDEYDSVKCTKHLLLERFTK